MPLALLKSCFNVVGGRGSGALTGDEGVDEALFSALFEATIHESKESTPKALDHSLLTLLSTWSPLGSRTDQCLNSAAAEGLTECECFLLVARGFPSRAFQLLLHSLHDDPTKWRRVLSLAEAHPVEAVEGRWVLVTFNRLLDADRWPECVSLIATVVEKGMAVAANGLSEMVEKVFERGKWDDGEEAAVMTGALKLVTRL